MTKEKGTILEDYFICSFQNSLPGVYPIFRTYFLPFLSLDFFFLWIINYNVGWFTYFISLLAISICFNLCFLCCFCNCISTPHQFIYSAKTKRFVIWGQIHLILFQICENEAEATLVSFLAVMFILDNNLCCFLQRRAKYLTFSSLHKINFGPYHKL